MGPCITFSGKPVLLHFTIIESMILGSRLKFSHNKHATDYLLYSSFLMSQVWLRFFLKLAYFFVI